MSPGQKLSNRKGNTMPDILDVLEELGRNAQLRNASNDRLEIALNSLSIDPAISSAVLSRDQVQLENMHATNVNVCCILAPSEDDESEERPDEVPADDEDTQAIAVL